MAKELELGQIAHGNPVGDYGTGDFEDALVDALLSEIDRVYWNNYQEQWHQNCDPKLEGVEFQHYYWGDNQEKAAKPNLKFSHSPQEIRWYKHPGRGNSCSVEMGAQQWKEWFDGAMKIIRSNEKPLY